MTTRVLWHGRDVGVLGCDSPAEIAERCIVEDLGTAQEDAEAKLLRDDTAEDLVWSLVTERFKDWGTQDFLVPLVEEALEFLRDSPGEEWEGFTLGIPDERIFWWSVGGELAPVEGTTPEDLAGVMVQMNRHAAAHFAVGHYLEDLYGSDTPDYSWEQDLAQGLIFGDSWCLRSRVASVLRRYWDDLLANIVLMRPVPFAGDLFTLNNGPEE